LATAEQFDLSGARALEGFIVGREVRNSLDSLFSDRNSGVGPGAKGWHSNGILGSIAAACSAGNTLRLDGKQMIAAIGLAAGSCGALTRDGGTMAKPFRAGHAAATGLTSVLLARSGFSSDETVLEGRYGLLDALSPLPQAAIRSLGRNLGQEFELENKIKSKPLASCTATHSATEAMIRLVHKHPIDPQSVASIECDLKPYPLIRHHPRRGYEGRFSLPFCLAIVLIYGRLKPDDFTDENVTNPDVQALIQKTFHTPGATSLRIKLKDETCLSEDLTGPSNYVSVEEITEKFHRCVDDRLGSEQAGHLIAAVQQLDQSKSVGEMTKLVRPVDDR
jgi:2-methylcitrate dehydratase PrpD